MKGGAHREDVVGEVSAALEVGGDGDLGVLDDGEVRDGVQLEQAKAKVCSEISSASCKREERRLELGVLAGELWARRRSARRRGSGMQRSYQRFRTLRRVWWRGRLARGALESAEFLAEVPARGSEIQSRMGAGLWRKRRGKTLSGGCARTW
jgi:hypothetical protein